MCPGLGGAETSYLAAIYARVSSTGQLGRDGDGYSIPAQIDACKRDLESRGARVVRIYIERAEPAKGDDRPELQKMMRELPSLGLYFLGVHKVDRFGA